MNKQSIVSLAMGMSFMFHTLGQGVQAQEPAMSPEADSVRTVISFETSGSADRWISIDDNVMGGISKGGIAITEDSCLQFSGSLSLENNGGFASIRTRPSDFDLSGYSGIRIRVKGDGRSYQFRIRVDDRYDGIAFKQDFRTVDNVWLEFDLPFGLFIPTYRGRVPSNVGPLNAAEIMQVGFMVADKSAGPFKLTVAEIKAFR